MCFAEGMILLCSRSGSPLPPHGRYLFLSWLILYLPFTFHNVAVFPANGSTWIVCRSILQTLPHRNREFHHGPPDATMSVQLSYRKIEQTRRLPPAFSRVDTAVSYRRCGSSFRTFMGLKRLIRDIVVIGMRQWPVLRGISATCESYVTFWSLSTLTCTKILRNFQRP